MLIMLLAKALGVLRSASSSPTVIGARLVSGNLFNSICSGGSAVTSCSTRTSIRTSTSSTWLPAAGAAAAAVNGVISNVPSQMGVVIQHVRLHTSQADRTRSGECQALRHLASAASRVVASAHNSGSSQATNTSRNSSSSSSNRNSSLNTISSRSSGSSRQHVQPAQVTALIKAAPSPQMLLELLQQFQPAINPIHISAAVVRLRQLCQQQQGLLQQPALQQALDHVQQLLEPALIDQCQARGLASIMHAAAWLGRPATVSRLLPVFLARLQHDGEATPQASSCTLWAVATAELQLSAEQLQQLLGALISKQHQADAKCVSNCLWALATMRQQVPEEQLQQLLDALVQARLNAKPQAISSSLWAVAKMQQVVLPEQLQQLLDAFVNMQHAVNPKEASTVLWAVASMGHEVSLQHTQHLLEVLLSQQDKVKPQDLSNAVWAVATMGQQVAHEHLQELLAALLSKRRDAHPRAMSKVLWAAANMGQQLSAKKLRGLLAVLIDKHEMAAPADTAMSLWAVAAMGQHVAGDQLQPLLAGLISKQHEVQPHDVSKALWATATMSRRLPAEQLITFAPAEQLRALLALVTDQLQAVGHQTLSSTLWACAHLRYVPSQLLSALECQQQLLHQLVADMSPQALANSAWACAMLGYSSSQLPGMILHQAARLLQQQDRASVTPQVLGNLCWAAAVLDLREHVPTVLQLAQACSDQWGSCEEAGLHQLYQGHLWLLDCKLPEAPQGLAGCLTAGQLGQCRASWRLGLKTSGAPADASVLQQSVLAALQLLPASTWQQPPAIEQRTPDGEYIIDITATTAEGLQLAVEVDGPSHFLRPDRAVDGPTALRNRALAARGYVVVSIPCWQWVKLRSCQKQQHYLMGQLQQAACSNMG